MAARDLFQSNLRVPAKVCILAPGPNGKNHHVRIPADYEVIAVNKAILIDDVPRKSYWVMTHATQDWFEQASERFRGIRIFSADALREAQERLGAAATESAYYFLAPPDLIQPDTVDRVDGAIRYGATVSCCALQFAYNFGARRILLCGVDMSGDNYWDGQRNPGPYHGDVWPAARTMSCLIRWLRHDRRIEVATLSPTRLEVPDYQSEGSAIRA
jgi:hypothetical protein